MYLVHIRNEYYFYSEHIKESFLASVKIYEMSGGGCGMCETHTHTGSGAGGGREERGEEEREKYKSLIKERAEKWV